MLRDLCAVAFVCALAVFNGDYFFRKIRLVPGQYLSAVIHKYAIGITAYVALFQILGIFGILYPNVLFGIVVINIVFLAWTKRSLFIDHHDQIAVLQCYMNRSRRGHRANISGLLFALPQIAIAGYLPFLKASNAIYGYDSLAYHVYTPYRALHITHSLNSFDLIPNAGLSLGTNSVFGLLSIFGSPQSSMYFQFFTYMILVIAVSQLLLRLSKPKHFAIFVVIVMLLLTLGPTTVSSPGTDLQVAFFLIVIADYFWALRNSEILELEKIVYGALLIGFLPVIKLLSAPIALTLFIYLLFEVHRMNVGRFIKSVVLGVVAFSALSAIWHVKNWLDTGNPFYPAFRKYLGGIGYVKGVRTEEDDFRQTFQQSIQAIKSCHPSSFISTCGGGLQLFIYATVIFLVMFSVVHLVRRDGFNQLSLFLCVALFGMIPILGIMPRYFVGPIMYLVIWQSLLIFNNQFNSERVRTKFGGMWRWACAVAVLFGSTVFVGRLNGWSNDWQQQKVQKFDRYWSYSGQPELDSFIGALVSNGKYRDVRYCLVGDGRAMLFWPLDVLVIPRDTRNPLEQSVATSIDEILKGFRSMGCHLIIYTSQWDEQRSKQVLDMLLLAQKERVIYENTSFKLFDLTS